MTAGVSIGIDWDNNVVISRSHNCLHVNGCKKAAVAKIPLLVRFGITEDEMSYPTRWEQNTDGHANCDKGNIRAGVGDSATTINELCQDHEEGHQKCFESMVQDRELAESFLVTVKVTACANDETKSIQLLIDNIGHIMQVIIPEKTNEFSGKLHERFVKDDKNHDAAYWNSVGVDGEHWKKTNEVKIIPGGLMDQWQQTKLKKD